MLVAPRFALGIVNLFAIAMIDTRTYPIVDMTPDSITGMPARVTIGRSNRSIAP